MSDMPIWNVTMTTSPQPPYTTHVTVVADTVEKAVAQAEDLVGGKMVKAVPVTKLKWTRDPHSGWWANGETYGYQLRKDGKSWLLKVREVIETAGIRHQVGSEEIVSQRARYNTVAEGKAVVQYFENMERKDIYEAWRAYWAAERQPQIDRLTAEYDAMIAARKDGA